jgi:FkbM family methyltransferase
VLRVNLEALADSWHRRRQRGAYRAMLKRWNDDGGDTRFRFDYALDERSLVLDVGGYEGRWSSDLYERYRCRIVVFEPVARFAREIEARFRGNAAVSVCAFGLGATTRGETIYVHGAGSSTHRRRSSPETIRIVDVVEWLDAERVENIALMKVNIEGGEYELLERLLDAGRIGSVKNLQVQFHDFTLDASRRMESIQLRLQATHRPTYQYRFIWENWQRKT